MELILPKPGRYLVAVSGGLDSVCLLDILATNPDYELSVAHFDHGIRVDSSSDCKFVESLARKYRLPFLSDEGKLGPNASESVAREARYAFLKQARKQSNSIAIITAHHQDDRLETLIINLIRGTGRLGISSIGETKEIKRPLLNISRAELKNYGVRHKLNWREDPSNNDQRYLRNYVRHNLLPKISEQDKQHLVKLMNHQADLNEQIDKLVPRLLNASDINRLSLKTLNSLPFGESSELIATWLRLNNLAAFNRSTIERINVAAKTKAKGARIDVYGRARVEIEDGCLALYDTER